MAVDPTAAGGSTSSIADLIRQSAAEEQQSAIEQYQANKELQKSKDFAAGLKQLTETTASVHKDGFDAAGKITG